jgi:hypothetical protein
VVDMSRYHHIEELPPDPSNPPMKTPAAQAPGVFFRLFCTFCGVAEKRLEFI